MPVRHALHAAALVLALILAAVPGGSLAAQTLVVYNVDASRFPTISANVALLDARGNRTPSIDPAEITIVEDGFPATDITIDCPPVVPAQPFHAVLVNDRSGSMTTPVAQGLSRMELAKLGSREFVLATSFSSGATVAVTSFESTASIESDFQSNAATLLTAIDNIVPGGGTLYNPPFLDPLVGAIGMLASRPDGVRRVIVFLTDGEPNEPTEVMRIIAAARDAGIEIYAVTLGMPMTGELRTMSDLTGGLAFGNVSTREQMRAVYQQIALDAGGNEPCTITWRSRVRCGESSRNRTAIFTHTPTGATTRASFVTPPSSVGGISVAPSFAHFGSVGPPETLERVIVISSPNDSMRIDRAAIVPEGVFSVVDWGGAPPPFVEPPGATRTIRVSFAPPDSQKYVASLVLYGGACPPYPVTLTGGVGPDGGPSLKLLAPLGGESFAGCDSILIRWGGVAPTTPIDIDASGDDGATWRPVARAVSGLQYRWMPPAPGTAWRIRIRSDDGVEQHLITTIAGGGTSMSDSIQALAAQLLTPTGVAVRGDSMFIAEAGQHRIRRVDLASGVITTIAGDGNPGSNGAVVARLARLNSPTHVLLLGTYLFVADYGNHRVRRINLIDGRIFPVAGTGASGYSGDSASALDAQLQYPSFLASNGTHLFVGDAGNSRVRRIDLSSGIIVTVAGGGTSIADDIAATQALLQAPAGIAVDGEQLYIAEDLGRRIRRVDLRTGIITTVAGTGMEGSTGDGGQASAATFMRPLGVTSDGARLYVTDTAAHRVRMIDLATGVITTIAGTGAPGFSGDGGDATLARLNTPSQPDTAGGYLFVPDIRNGRIRPITVGRGPASDSSRSAFAVSVPRLAVGLPRRELALGPMALGRPRDSAAAGAICSVGDMPLVVEGVSIVGAHAGDFRVVSGAPSGEIAPGSCIPLEIRFRPSALGTRTAMAILRGRCASVDTVWLSGIGVDTCGTRALDLADVGQITLGAGSRDTLIEQAICNTETRTISGFARIVSGGAAFTIVEGAGAFTLAPGACHQVRVRFAPVATGRASGEIDYGLPTSCGASRTRLFGRAVGTPGLSAPALVAFPASICGASIDTTIVVVNTGAAPLAIIGARFVDNDEGFALVTTPPTPASPIEIAPSDSAALAIRFAPASAGDKAATLELVANLPDSLHRMELRGRRELIAVAATPVVAFPFDGATLPRDTAVVVRNGGTAAVEITGATILDDPASFAVVAGQLPITLAAGEDTVIRVRQMLAPSDTSRRARFVLTYGPSCDSGRVVTTLLAAGTGPEIVVAGPQFRPLICPDESMRDTTVLIMNEGGSDLVISRVAVTDDASAAFSVDVAGPFTIAAGADTTIAVRFAPVAPGSHTATLRIESNARPGVEEVALAVRRELVELAAAPLELALDAAAPGTPLVAQVMLSNTGTISQAVSVASTRGLVAIDAPVGFTIGASGSHAVTLRATPTSGGLHHDTLVVRESSCGIERRIPIVIDVAVPSVARVTLPHMTAAPGRQLAIPVTIAITDRASFDESGARGYSATVSMYGTVFLPDGVRGATLVANDYDMATRRQTVTLAGEYSGTAVGGVVDTLAWITGRTILGDTLGTPLTLESFTWDMPEVGAELVDGSLTIVGSCLDLGLRLVAVPSIRKVRPMPVNAHATLELTLDEWASLRIVLYDNQGLPVHTLPERIVDAGPQSLELDLSHIPAGRYTLAAETIYGRSTTPILILD